MYTIGIIAATVVGALIIFLLQSNGTEHIENDELLPDIFLLLLTSIPSLIVYNIAFVKNVASQDYVNFSKASLNVNVYILIAFVSSIALTVLVLLASFLFTGGIALASIIIAALSIALMMIFTFVAFKKFF